MPANWTCPETGKMFLTGLTAPTPRHRLMAATPHVPLEAPPLHVAYVPKYRSNYGNDRFGDCVTAEEAFAKSCYFPEIIISDNIVTGWARQHGVLNGAMLDEVLDWMATKGFQVGQQLYNDGGKSAVDFANEIVLQSAIAQGPVKIAMAAGALPGGAGSRDGWFSLDTNNGRTDHSTSLCGYGTADWLYQQLGVPLPAGLPANTPGYLLYTWSTIGFVHHNWLMGTCDEGWLRNPTTLGVPPLTPPSPPTPPGPTPDVVGELTIADGRMTMPVNMPNGNYIIFPKTVL